MWRSEHREAWSENREGAAHLNHELVDYLDARRECGLGRMLTNLVLAPPDPFKPKARRGAKKGFVIIVFTVVAFVAWFVWFNLIH